MEAIEQQELFLAKEFLKHGPSESVGEYKVWDRKDLDKRIILEGPDIESSKVIKIVGVKYSELENPFDVTKSQGNINGINVNVKSQIEVSGLHVWHDPAEEPEKSEDVMYILQEVTTAGSQDTSLVLITPDGEKTVVEAASYGQLTTDDSDSGRLNSMHAKSLVKELANLTIESRIDNLKTLRMVTKPYEKEGINVQTGKGHIKLENPGRIEDGNLKKLNDILPDLVYGIRIARTLTDAKPFVDDIVDYADRIQTALEFSSDARTDDLILTDQSNDIDRSDKTKELVDNVMGALSGFQINETGEAKLRSGITELLQTFGLKTTLNIVNAIKSS